MKRKIETDLEKILTQLAEGSPYLEDQGFSAKVSRRLPFSRSRPAILLTVSLLATLVAVIGMKAATVQKLVGSIIGGNYSEPHVWVGLALLLTTCCTLWYLLSEEIRT